MISSKRLQTLTDHPVAHASDCAALRCQGGLSCGGAGDDLGDALVGQAEHATDVAGGPALVDEGAGGVAKSVAFAVVGGRDLEFEVFGERLGFAIIR
ncbi:hypothetical protein [Nonomuraea sp. NPDC049141]|uniref:hypothetical protein n=1 Tax=Nonomuraea sp. NPDC049141 TaxID=3155500 RepID=UPI0033C1643E